MFSWEFNELALEELNGDQASRPVSFWHELHVLNPEATLQLNTFKQTAKLSRFEAKAKSC